MNLVHRWPTVMWRSWTVRIAAAGVLLPEVINLVLRELEHFPISETNKSYIRLGALILAILLRPVQQPALAEINATDPKLQEKAVEKWIGERVQGQTTDAEVINTQHAPANPTIVITPANVTDTVQLGGNGEKP